MTDWVDEYGNLVDSSDFMPGYDTTPMVTISGIRSTLHVLEVRHDPYGAYVTFEMQLENMEAVNGIIENVRCGRITRIHIEDGTRENIYIGRIMSYTISAMMHGPTTIRFEMSLTDREVVTPKEEYPHTCQKCGQKLKFQELKDANSWMDEDKLRAMWISNEVSFYCCTCYRRENGLKDWGHPSLQDGGFLTPGAARRLGLDNSEETVGSMIWNGEVSDTAYRGTTNDIIDSISHSLGTMTTNRDPPFQQIRRLCGTCTFGMEISRGGRNIRCSLNITQIHLDTDLCNYNE